MSNELSEQTYWESLRLAGASTVSAVLDMRGLDGIISGIPFCTPGPAYAGPAFTVKIISGALGSFKAEEFNIPSYVDAAPEGSVLAVDVGGAAISISGGVAARVTALRGVRGWVVDGGMRDADELRESGVPIHVRHLTSVSGRTRVRVEATQVPISVAGVHIQPGDIMVGDESGIACVPRAELYAVARMSNWIRERDNTAMQLVHLGNNFKEAFSKATALQTEKFGQLPN